MALDHGFESAFGELRAAWLRREEARRSGHLSELVEARIRLDEARHRMAQARRSG